MRRWIAIAVLAAAGTASLPSFAFDPAWTHVATVTLNAAYQDEAPVVVPVFLGGFDSTWHANAQADGDDIRVTEDDDTTERDYYLVAYDAGADTGCIIVNVDGYASASVDKDLRIFIGNSGASAGSDAAATFAGYAAYYLPGMSTSNLANPGTYDLTAYNTPGTEASAFEGLTAATYNGTDEYHQYSGAITSAWPMSIGMLLKPSSTALQYAGVLTVYTSSDNIFGIYTNSGGATGAVLGNGGSAASATQNSAVSNGTTDLLMVTRNATSGTSYIRDNSGSASNATTVNAFGSADRLTIGALAYASSTLLYFSGSVSQLEYSTSARSADYFTTMYDAWFTAGFRTYGATEANSGGATGHPWFYMRYRA